MSIHVSTLVRAPLPELWDRALDPEQHVRWDLRFTAIEPEPAGAEGDPQRFRYRTRIGVLELAGAGEYLAAPADEASPGTTSLRFWSDHPLALIREGRGYWRFEERAEGVEFSTGYDYEVRWGAFGRAVDLLFRPLIAAATAWSFDRVRLWVEQGQTPEHSLRLALAAVAARGGVAAVWLWHGLVPKLLTADPTELKLLVAAGAPVDRAPELLAAAGVAELLFGLLVLLAPGRRAPLWLTIAAMAAALIGVAATAPSVLTAAFNPVTTNLSVALLAALALVLEAASPSSRRTRWSA